VTKQTRMGIEDAFLHDILAHPDDDAPRLIFADWLDEHNDPRGEFIRIQCALAQLSDEDPRRWPLELREQELLCEHEAKWLPKGRVSTSPRSLHVRCIFHRGFVEEIELSPGQFLSDADRLFEQAPIRRLHLDPRGWERTGSPDASLAQVFSSSHLARIQSLSLSGFFLSRSELHEFLSSPTLLQLTELGLLRLLTENEGRPLGHMAQSGEIIHELTELPCRVNLTSLYLENAVLSLDALRLLANSSSFVRLRELNLNGNRLTHQAARVLAEGRLLPQLETLHLDSNLVGDAGALIVREWPALPRLMRLSLGQNQIFAGGVKALAEAPALRGLISLNVARNIACDEGTAALASASWTRLQALNLWFNGVGDKGVRALAHSELLAQLSRLNLKANCITSAGAQILIESPRLSRLARIDLQRNDIEAAEQQRLRDRFGPFVSC
jgi:uncharacterized protein (TIGR02996 family)